MSSPDSVILLGTSPFTPSGTAGEFSAPAFSVDDTVTVILVSFDATSYPIESHCCYAVRQDANAPYTFPNITFRQAPPGLRTGPWPGWRGIPAMPSVALQVGDAATDAEFQFWGDELQTRLLRAVARIDMFHGDHISLHVSDARIVPLKAEFFAVRQLRSTPFDHEIPSALLDQHPRLLVSPDDLRALRESPSSSRLESLRRVRGFLSRWDSPLIVTAESKIPPGTESLTPEDRVLIGAFLALVKPSAADVKRGIQSLLDYCALSEKPDFTPLTIDTQSGETLFLLCIGYDWLFQHLSADEEQRIRQRLWEIADICWNHLGYGRRDYAQAHYLGCGMGLLAFSLLFHDSHPRAQEWSAHCSGVLRLVLSALPEDGFFPHGINLWIYEFGFLLRWMELLRTGAGLDLWPRSDLFRNASLFRSATTTADGLYGVTFGDPQFRVGGDSWCHYLIASRTGSPEARWLGDLVRDLAVQDVDFRNAPARRRVYECLWYPEHVTPVPPSERFMVFRDGGQVFVRTADSLFTFRAGPPLGGHRLGEGIMGGFGHSDPCNGAFLLWHNGRPALAGPGPVYRRDSSLHNVVTINGQGQIGDSAVWMPDFIPPSRLAPTPDVRSGHGVLSATVELAPSYLPHLQVKSLRRSMLVIPGRYILGTDVIDLTAAATIGWNQHSWGTFTHVTGQNDLTFKIETGTDPAPSLTFSSTEVHTWHSGLSEFVPAYPNAGERDRYLRITSTGSHVMFAWSITLVDEPPRQSLHERDRAVWTFPNRTAAEFDGTWIILRGQS